MSRARTHARRAAVQALYQWQITGQPPAEISIQFRDDQRLEKLDRDLFDALLFGVTAHRVALDDLLGPLLDRPVGQVDLVERAILRLGAYELAHCEGVPWRVVVNEGVDLAHTFGAEQSHRYVNGVLDRLARKLRAAETGTG